MKSQVEMCVVYIFKTAKEIVVCAVAIFKCNRLSVDENHTIVLIHNIHTHTENKCR